MCNKKSPLTRDRHRATASLFPVSPNSPSIDKTIGLMLVCLSLAACNPNTSPTAQVTPVPTPSVATASPPASPSPIASVAPTPTTNKPSVATLKPESAREVAVKVYQANDQCSGLSEKTQTFPTQDTLKAVVGKVIEQSNTSDFTITGYRVAIKQGGVATIDFQVPSDAKRQLASLSSCEQMALFGSLEKTLRGHTAWKIRDVKFMSGNEEVVI